MRFKAIQRGEQYLIQDTKTGDESPVSPDVLDEMILRGIVDASEVNGYLAKRVDIRFEYMPSKEKPKEEKKPEQNTHRLSTYGLNALIKNLKEAKVAGYQSEAINAIEDAVNTLEMLKRAVFSLHRISSMRAESNEWDAVAKYSECQRIAERAMRMTEPEEKWTHPNRIYDNINEDYWIIKEKKND